MLVCCTGCFLCSPCFHAYTEYAYLIGVAVETGRRSNAAPACTGKTRDAALMNQPVVDTAAHSFSCSLSFLENSKQCHHRQRSSSSLPNYRIRSTHSLKSRCTAKPLIWICCKDLGFWPEQAKKKNRPKY